MNNFGSGPAPPQPPPDEALGARRAQGGRKASERGERREKE
jgi:hypothetical protein